jgi:hypothetical protein
MKKSINAALMIPAVATGMIAAAAIAPNISFAYSGKPNHHGHRGNGDADCGITSGSGGSGDGDCL